DAANGGAQQKLRQGCSGQRPDDQRQRQREETESHQHHRAAREAGQRELGEGRRAEDQGHDGPTEGVVLLVQHPRQKGGRQGAEQPQEGGGGAAQLRERGGGGPGHQPGGQPRQDTAGEQPAEAGGDDERRRAQRAEAEGGGQDRFAPDLVRGAPGEEERGEDAPRVGGKEER